MVLFLIICFVLLFGPLHNDQKLCYYLMFRMSPNDQGLSSQSRLFLIIGRAYVE